MTAYKLQPVFVCCLWAHPAPAPGSSVEQGQIEIKTKDKHFRAGEFSRGKCLHDRNYGGRAAKTRQTDTDTRCAVTAAVLVS